MTSGGLDDISKTLHELLLVAQRRLVLSGSSLKRDLHAMLVVILYKLTSPSPVSFDHW